MGKLAFSVEQLGYSLEFWGEVDGEDNPIPTLDESQPCMTELTVTYQGDDPAGVTQWEVCHYDPGGAPVGGWDMAVPNLSVERCATLESLDPTNLAHASDATSPSFDYNSPLQIVSKSATELVIRCLYRYPQNPSTIDGGSAFTEDILFSAHPILFVNAQTADDGWILGSTLAGCPEMKVVQDVSRYGYSPALTCEQSVRWDIEAVQNAGPYSDPGAPSDTGKRIVIRTTGCWNDEAPPITGGDLGDPEFFDRDWEEDADCCADEPADQAEWDSVTSTFTDFTRGPAELTAVLPPRTLPKWDGTKTAPRLYLRWPLYDPDTDLLDETASAADATYGAEIIGYTRIYHAYVGTVSEKLTLESAGYQDPLAAAAAAAKPPEDSLDLYANALLGGGLAEVDVSTASIASSSPASLTKPRPARATLRATASGCCDCCGCYHEDNSTLQAIYRLQGDGDDLVFTVNHDTLTIGGTISGGGTTTYTYKTVIWELAEDEMQAAYGTAWRGEVIGMVTDGTSRMGVGLGAGFGGVFQRASVSNPSGPYFQPLEFRREQYVEHPIVPREDCDGEPYTESECIACDCNYDVDPIECTTFSGGTGGYRDFFYDTEADPIDCAEHWQPAGSQFNQVAKYTGTIDKQYIQVCGTGPISHILNGYLGIQGRPPENLTCDLFNPTIVSFSSACDSELEPYDVHLHPDNVRLPPQTLTTFSGELTEVHSVDGLIASSGPVGFDSADRGYILLLSSCPYHNAWYPGVG